MDKNIFNEMKEKLHNYKFTSLGYTDYEDVEKFEVIKNTNNLLLIGGYSERDRTYEYCFAANKAEDIINEIHEDNCIFMFIPKEWVNTFEKAGFHIRNAWHDYFKVSLDDINHEERNAVSLKESEIKEAVEVTLSCRNKSRGFTGETEEFVNEWINDEAPENHHSRIFVEKNDDEKIIGVVFTTIYGYDDKRGAVSWIRELCVVPEYQNKGIGRKLIKQALSHGKKHGAVKGFLAVDEMNVGAIHLYKSMGFEESKEESEIDMVR